MSVADNMDMAAMRAATLEAAANPSTPLNAEESAALVKEKGWAERQAYDYKKFSNDRSTREAEAGDTAEEAQPVYQDNWLSSAVRYEWDDEFGEVGPEIPKLEEQLFKDQFRQEKGTFLGAYEFKVTCEGPNTILPIRSVRVTSACHSTS